jgi:DNA-binding transcriptional ArsR family regulator
MITQPLRLEIVDVVAHHGPCSIGDVANMIGRNPSTLYFHVNKLLETGLLIAAGERGSGRERETLYRTPGVPVNVVYDATDDNVVEATVRYATAILSRARRALTKAFRSRNVVTDGPQRNAHADQISCWLDKRELARVNRHLDAVRDIVTTGLHRRGTKLHLITVAIAPLEVKHPRLRERAGKKGRPS